MRLLILALVIYLAWKAVKTWISQSAIANRQDRDLQSGQADDIMVKDPYCGVYFPRREAVELRKDSKTLYFCSPECRDRYLNEGGENKTDS